MVAAKRDDRRKENDGVGIVSTRSINESKKTLPPSNHKGRQDDIVSDKTFFDAMRRPTDEGGTNDSLSFLPRAERDGNGVDDSPPYAPAMANDPFAPTEWGTDGEGDTDVGRDRHHNNDHDDDHPDEDSNGSIQEDDRGYDLDTDLLGLRSDSPPLLDHEHLSKIHAHPVDVFFG
jgi:hypothetical protein